MDANRLLFERAVRVIPGGVNSPVRAFGSVGGTPYFVERADGPYVWDADGHRYIDYVQSYGPSILGHAHPGVVDAVNRAAADGTSYGAPTEAEIRLAETVVERVEGLEALRFVNSGTEATMTAPSICSSDNSSASDSTINTALSVPATTKFNRDSVSSLTSGLST